MYFQEFLCYYFFEMFAINSIWIGDGGNKFPTPIHKGYVFPPFFSAPRLLNLKSTKANKETVFIGRPSRWGNPYKLSRHTRQEAIALYETHLLDSGLIHHLYELKFKQLACFCFPEACHGEILLKYLTPLEKDNPVNAASGKNIPNKWKTLMTMV